MGEINKWNNLLKPLKIEYEDKNHWKIPPSLSSCSTGTVTFLCLFKNNDWLLCRWLCCWWRFKGAGVRASGRSPPLPLYNRPFCHFPSHPATSLPQAVPIIVSHWEAEVERKIISLIVSRIKLYVYLKVEGGDFDGSIIALGWAGREKDRERVRWLLWRCDEIRGRRVMIWSRSQSDPTDYYVFMCNEKNQGKEM